LIFKEYFKSIPSTGHVEHPSKSCYHYVNFSSIFNSTVK
jgi:hypothetical protein